LPVGWQLEDSGQQRVLSHDGVPALLVQYDGDSHWSGRSRLENRLEGYSLTIESAQQAGG